MYIYIYMICLFSLWMRVKWSMIHLHFLASCLWTRSQPVDVLPLHGALDAEAWCMFGSRELWLWRVCSLGWGVTCRDLTYPLPRHLWRWFSFSPDGICQFPGGYAQKSPFRTDFRINAATKWPHSQCKQLVLDIHPKRSWLGYCIYLYMSLNGLHLKSLEANATTKSSLEGESQRSNQILASSNDLTPNDVNATRMTQHFLMFGHFASFHRFKQLTNVCIWYAFTLKIKHNRKVFQ